MPTVPPPSRDAVLETRVVWERFKNAIVAGLIIVLLAIAGFGGYRFYSSRRAAAASALLGSAKGAQDYQQVIADYPNTPAGGVAYLRNLESMGKTEEALSMYQQVASTYPNNFNAPLALLSQVPILRAKNRIEEARHVCETILTRYRASFWANEAAQQLRLLKPSGPSQPEGTPAIPPFLAAPAPTPAASVGPKAAPTPK